MNSTFVITSGVMVLAALGFVLLPLLRARSGGGGSAAASRRRALDDALSAGVISAEEHALKLAALEQSGPARADTAAPRTRGAFAGALLTLLLLPALAIGLYFKLGNVQAMDPVAQAAAPGTPGPDMDAAVQGLAAKLANNPDDVEGWMLLARAYKSMERFDDARDALKNAYDRAADNVDVKVDYAEALALAGQGRRIQGQARELLDAAIKADAKHQRALWLLGIAEYQQQNYTAAVDYWERLRSQLPSEADARGSLDTQIADARQRAGMPDGGAAAAASRAPAGGVAAAGQADAGAAAGDIRLTVQVSLDDKLRDKAPAGASVFVFARAANGPPMPLAVQRLTLADLPATVTLTEAMGMLPNMKLSQFPQVVIGARISASGNPKAQSGDLQALSAPLDVKSTAPVKLTIDQVVP
ncbi:cytochrome c-type biogenesis protein CcmH [Tahibacter aquaticus]|uniref:Cytochrome c-type biogenesis protein CcmH n=1 Tax=Tahibacter aquaticus TaxID=520092 RepID=A0A4R6YWL0_9GAMM|nr:c-type cytochrome biogenesis protein CcmI [Tahibacter aquaticus]TDR43208.1 cytochrome c-type biogenesis protein CcmH [Tahibacter aquaticus]